MTNSQLDFNKKQYENNFQQYLENNASSTIGGNTPQKRVELIKLYLPLGRTIFEIGSGGGDDALELQKVGYQVIASDFVERFIDVLKQKGLRALQFDAKKDKIPEIVDAIYANAVFVHFSPEEVIEFFKKAKSKLKNAKIVFLSVLKGEGYERSARGRGFERDFYYYTVDSLKDLLKKEGYLVLYSNEIDNKWLHIICEVN